MAECGTASLGRQLQFVLEADKLKGIFRQTYLLNDPRKENDAEHSWHIALMAAVLCGHAGPELDLLRVLKMLLVHDLVEIDAGDTFCYDAAGNQTKLERELVAAERIFNLLPGDQAREFRQLWDEFEARHTPEARYAAAIDRLQPLLHNLHTQGRAWREHGVTVEQVLERNRHIADGAPALWQCVEPMIREAAARGHLAGGGDRPA